MPEETPEGQEPEGTEEPKTFDEGYVKELRREAAARRKNEKALEKRVEELDAELKGLRDKDKPEIERLTEEKAALERKLQEKDQEITENAKRSRIIAEAMKLNVVDPDAVYRLLDPSTLEDPEDVKRAIAALLKEKPWLIKDATPPTPGTGGPPVVGKKSPDQMLTDMLKRGAR